MEPFEGLRAGDRIAEKFRIERVLGEGGMGVVYLAQHEVLGERFAIKVLRPHISGSKEAVTRFVNEARAAVRVKNEHIAAVMDVGNLPDGSAYMVMEYLDGQDLSEALEARGPLPVEEAVDYVLQALEGLAYAHAEGIVHRDLKPANLFLTRARGGGTIVKVLDFGISKLAAQQLAEQGQAGVTSTKAMLGSPGYMSPEQVRSSRDVDARSDLWSIGVILYRLLTGSAPFDSDTLGGVLASILESSPAPIRTLRPDLPEELQQVIARCLTKDREARWQNAYVLAEALAPFAPHDGAARVQHVRRLLGISARPSQEAVLPPEPKATAPSQPPTSAVKDPSLSKDPSSVAAAAAPAHVLEPTVRVASAAEPAKSKARVPILIAVALVLVGLGVGLAVILAGNRHPKRSSGMSASTGAKHASSGYARPPRSPAAAESAAGGQAASEQAVKLREKGCQEGSMRDCAHLAGYLASGHGVAKNPKRAAELYQQACDKDVASACADLADLLSGETEGIPEDDDRAMKLLLKACKLDDASACSDAGKAYLTGDGVEEDDERGLSLLKQGCDKEDGHGCFYLGKAYEDGTGMQADLHGAIQLYERGCELDSLHACGALGAKLVKGAGIKEDKARGVSLLRKACKKIAAACDKLSELNVAP